MTRKVLKYSEKYMFYIYFGASGVEKDPKFEKFKKLNLFGQKLQLCDQF